ncbi:MAG: hypothetical protein EA424_21200 [Planctomycetaceae bacterium]|nr:MAG: hypothetical protein EA424_21200 [Planctomycetaceae bacterium]
MTTAQLVMSLIAFALPRPIRRMVTGRMGAPISLLLLMILVGSGVFSINWAGQRPRLAIDRERAEQVKRRVADRVQSVRSTMGETHDGPRLTSLLAEFAGLNQAIGHQFSAEVRSPDVATDSIPPSAGQTPPNSSVPVVPPVSPEPASPVLPSHSQQPADAEVIRIAALPLSTLSPSTLAIPQMMDILVDFIRRFDMIAVQDIRAVDDSTLPTFVSMVNAQGARYAYLLGPPVGRSSSPAQYAFLFDSDRLEVDMGSVYTVPVPPELMERQPLVARFRVRKVPVEHAFTFTLVNVQVQADRMAVELDTLADVFLSVQRNGSGEDDVILLGDLGDSKTLGRIGQFPNITATVPEPSTDRHQESSTFNLLYDTGATVEHTGRSGVLNLMSLYGLSREQALFVSQQKPIWAEFSVYEGGIAPVARLPRDAQSWSTPPIIMR